MKKTVITLMIALFLGVLAVNAVVAPFTVAYAAEQNSDGQDQTDNQKSDGGHSGHH